MGKPILFVYEGDDRADRVAEFCWPEHTHTHTLVKFLNIA
jgi:hypothetical protein